MYIFFLIHFIQTVQIYTQNWTMLQTNLKINLTKILERVRSAGAFTLASRVIKFLFKFYPTFVVFNENLFEFR